MGVKRRNERGKRERERERKRKKERNKKCVQSVVVVLYYSINAITRFSSGGWQAQRQLPKVVVSVT